jgi:hypothetical protein
VFINQVPQKIGVTFGSREDTTGGNALKFYASVRLDIRRIGAVKKGEESIGNKVRVKVVKNKLAPPFRSVELEILYGRGICRVGELLQRAEETGVLTRNGAWYSMGDERLGQGREAVREAMLSDAALADRNRRDAARPPGPGRGEVAVAAQHRRNAEVYQACAALVRDVDEVARSLEGDGDPRLAQWVRRSALTLAMLVAEGDRRRAVVSSTGSSEISMSAPGESSRSLRRSGAEPGGAVARAPDWTGRSPTLSAVGPADRHDQPRPNGGLNANAMAACLEVI